MQTENNHTMDYNPVTRFLIAGGAIGPLLFIVAILIEGATRSNYCRLGMGSTSSNQNFKIDAFTRIDGRKREVKS